MRKSFTQLFGFLLLSVMMLFSSGLYAQEAQSTVELYARSLDACYNATNSYTSKIAVRDFIKMKSFSLTLNFDKSKFTFDAVANANALLGTPVTATVDNSDPVLGIVKFTWTNTTEVTIGDNVEGGASLFDAKFKVLNFPNNSGVDLFNSTLKWDIPNSVFYYDANWNTGTNYQVETTNFINGTLNVPVNYSSIAYTTTTATCAGGQAQITITSPVGTGLLYYFNGSTTGSTSPVATAEAPSVNTVRIVDANGCYSNLFSIPVSAPDPLVFNAVTHEDPICFNDNGEITFQISGGTNPYTYWVVPDANYSQVQSDLVAALGITTAPVFAPFKYTNFQVLKPAGLYHVAVNDGNGCLDLRGPANWKTVTIAPITDPIRYTATAVNNTCNGYTDGSITVSGVYGGTGTAYTVSIDGIHWFPLVSGSYTFGTLAFGTYALQVKDINGCTVTSNVAVTQPVAITFKLAYDDASCGGAVVNDGAIWITEVLGGTSPYSYFVGAAGSATPTGLESTWVPVVAKNNTDATGIAANLNPNYYSVWVKDANNCIKPFANQDLSGNILPIQAPGALTFTTNADNADAYEVACNGGDFTLTVTAAGGTSPYTYSFSFNRVTNYTTTNTFLLTDLVSDTPVSVYVKDANGCTTNKTVIVNVPVVLDIYSFTNTLSPTCSLGTDGRTTVIVTGGTFPYQYSTDQVTWWIANNVLALPEGATTVYVKDANECITSDVVTIDPLTVSAFTAAPTGLIECNGNTTTQGIAITGLTWEGILDVPATRTIQYFVSGSSTTVFTSGAVFVPASVNGMPANDGNPETLIDFKTFGVGIYYVGARDQYGCTSAIKTVEFFQNSALQLASVVAKNSTCATLFDGTLTINTTGGTGQPLYAIVNNPIAISNLVASDFQYVETYDPITKIGKQVIQALRGTYYVVLRDVCITDNSISSGPWIVEGFKPIALNEVTSPVDKKDITCHDANDGKITVTGVTGGEPEGYPGYVSTAGYTYKLYLTGDGDVLKATNTTGQFTGLLEGSYYVTITDATNCPLYKTSTVTVVNPSTLTITSVAVTHFTCITSNDGVVAISAAGGTGLYWLAVNASVNGLGTDIKAGDWIAFPTATPTYKPYIATAPGDYKFFVKDANGCLATPVTVTVLAPKVLTPVVAVNTPVSCNNSLVPDGAVHINATGGFETTTPSFVHTYLFSLNSDFTGGLDKTNATGDFTGLAAGTYTVYVKATNTPPATDVYTYPAIACTYQLTFEVTQPLQYTYTGKVVKHVGCKGSNDGVFAVTVVSGGTPFVDPITGPEYYVQLTTTANPVLLPENWTRTTGKVVTFSNLPHAIYSVWIKDANGCLLPTGIEPFPIPVPIDFVWHKVASWEVMEPGTYLTASVKWDNDVTCFGGNDGKFTVTALGGVPPYRFAAKKSILPAHVFAPDPNSAEWLTNLGVFDSATAATWIIWAMDANGCIVGGEGSGTPVDEWRVQVRQPVQVDFSLSNTEPICFGTATGTITASSLVSAAGAPYSITVVGTDAAGNAFPPITRTGLAANNVVAINIPASVTKHVEPTPAHTTENAYTVTVTDKNGCSNSHSIVVWQNTELTADIVKADGAFLCPGDNSGVIEVVAAGGTGGPGGSTGTYSYRLWKDGVVFTSWVTIPSFLVEIGHTWKVEVKDGKGCLATDEMIINAPVGVTATLKETTCYSDTKASVIIYAVGEVNRTFLVRYRLNTDLDYTEWVPFTNEIPIGNLIFANNTPTQNFYYFQVKDDKGGCLTEFTKSFVPTQHPLEVTFEQDDLNATITITGAISPYTYQIGSGPIVTLPVDGNTFQVVNLLAPATYVRVTDAHGCFVIKEIPVNPVTVSAVPESGNNVPNTFDVVLTFNRDVTIPVDGITVTGGTAVITGSGKVRTVNITAQDQYLDVGAIKIVLANTITDAAGNKLVATTFIYHVIPTLTVTPPTTPIGTIFTVGLKFNEPVTGVLNGVTVTGGNLDNVASILGSGGTEYTLTVSATEKTEVTIVLSDAITDVSSNTNKFAGQTLTYTTGDFTAPQLVTWTPNNVTIGNNHPTLKMTFSENVVIGAGGSLKIYKVATTTPVLIIPITAAMINGKDVTVTYAATQNDLAKNTRYYVLVDGTALEDNAGNTFDGVSDFAVWTFRTGADPTVIVTPPTSPVATLFSIGLSFSEPVNGVLDKAGISVTGGTISSVSGVAGKDYTLTIAATEQTTVNIVLSNLIKDLDGNSFAGQTLTYTTGDFTKPELVTMSPSGGLVIADNYPTFKMTFDENVLPGVGGSLKVYKVNTTTAVLDIPITQNMISGKDVTVSYAVTQNGLDKNTRYYVLVDGTALNDNAGNEFIGVNDATVWTFKTGPVFATPVVNINDATLFKVYPNPFVDFVNVDNASQLSKVVVTNIAGQVVKEVVTPSNRIQLNELRSGIYFMSLYNMDNVIAKTAKIVKR